MLLMMMERGERIDEIVTFDTGWEFPEMYEHLGKLERQVGVKFTRLHPKVPFEQHRLGQKRYPLVEWEVTEADALAYCLERGFDWGGLYEKKKRVSCWCCPLQSLDDLRVLRERHPRLWAELRLMDEYSANRFRADYSVEQLESRFEEEGRQMGLFPED